MTINEISKDVTLIEGKKLSVSIAQVKEILKILQVNTDKKFYKFLRCNYKINK